MTNETREDEEFAYEERQDSSALILCYTSFRKSLDFLRVKRINDALDDLIGIRCKSIGVALKPP